MFWGGVVRGLDLGFRLLGGLLIGDFALGFRRDRCRLSIPPVVGPQRVLKAAEKGVSGTLLADFAELFLLTLIYRFIGVDGFRAFGAGRHIYMCCSVACAVDEADLRPRFGRLMEYGLPGIV